MKKTTMIAIVSMILLVVVINLVTGVPAYDSCKAAGNSTTTCALTVRWWVMKRFWGS